MNEPAVPAPGGPVDPAAGRLSNGRLSTHVLDTGVGRPAAGVAVTVHRLAPDAPPELVAETVTNADGRTDAPLLEGEDLLPGTYELSFAVGAYFAAAGRGSDAAEGGVSFLDVVPVRFSTAGGEHLHVPLLVTPWSYSTYRGS